MENEKCFCHLNGYKVKDADARRSIEELSDDFNKLSTNTENRINELTGKFDGILEENGVFKFTLPFDLLNVASYSSGNGEVYELIKTYINTHDVKPIVVFTDSANKTYVGVFDKIETTPFSNYTYELMYINVLSNGETFTTSGGKLNSITLNMSKQSYNDGSTSYGFGRRDGTTYELEFSKNNLVYIEHTQFEFNDYHQESEPIVDRSSNKTIFNPLIEKRNQKIYYQYPNEPMFIMKAKSFTGIFGLRSVDGDDLIYRSVNTLKNNSDDSNLVMEITINYTTKINTVTFQIVKESVVSGGSSESIGDLSTLTTTAKDNLVNAINEVDESRSNLEQAFNGLTTTAVEHTFIVNNPVDSMRAIIWSTDYLENFITARTTHVMCMSVAHYFTSNPDDNMQNVFTTNTYTEPYKFHTKIYETGRDVNGRVIIQLDGALTDVGIPNNYTVSASTPLLITVKCIIGIMNEIKMLKGESTVNE